ncbi:MAG: hypothetical protein A2X77_01350 [Gammaproteobacteria bacterium GWE2_42_36]|nr:MAG: hypothetical protein A2X77_01350 [Gammaproteobacteria bacterium GWE2_42_36]HCU05456.1 hypothetical protein [Coxiellaceae bacterium]
MKRGYFLSKRAGIRLFQAILLCGVMVLGVAQADQQCCGTFYAKACGTVCDFWGHCYGRCTDCNIYVFPLCGTMPSASDVESSLMNNNVIPWAKSKVDIAQVESFLESKLEPFISGLISGICKNPTFSGLCNVSNFVSNIKQALDSILTLIKNFLGIGSPGIGGILKNTITQNFPQASADTLPSVSILLKSRVQNWVDRSMPNARADMVSDVGNYLWNNYVSAWVSANINVTTLAQYVANDINIQPIETSIQSYFTAKIDAAIAAVTDPITDFINTIEYALLQVLCTTAHLSGLNAGGPYSIKGHDSIQCSWVGSGIGDTLKTAITTTFPSAQAANLPPDAQNLGDFIAKLPAWQNKLRGNAATLSNNFKTCLSSMSPLAKKILISTLPPNAAPMDNRSMAAAIYTKTNLGFDAITKLSIDDFVNLNICQKWSDLAPSLVTAMQYSANYMGTVDQDAGMVMPKSAEGTVEGINFTATMAHYDALLSNVEFGIYTEILSRTQDGGISSLTDMAAIATEVLSLKLQQMGVSDQLTSFIEGIVDFLSIPGQIRVQMATTIVGFKEMAASVSGILVGTRDLLMQTRGAIVSNDMNSLFDPAQQALKKGLS